VAKKISLPLLADAWGAPRKSAKPLKKPSLADARTRLGGRTTDEGPAPPGIAPGSIVKVVASGGTEHVAVVVFVNADEVHILVDGTKLRRVPPAAVDAHEGATPSSLSKIAADAQVFSRLAEGQQVRYADNGGGLLAGKLVEKCRYGGLVVREDGAVIAVGFRKLWPASASGASA
jgi:hypothetical protein